MQIFIITVLTITVTFLLNPVFRKINRKKSFKYHVHHSVLGVALLVTGVIVRSEVAAAVGLGIYLGHGVEEIYFKKTRFIKAFFIFVTR